MRNDKGSIMIFVVLAVSLAALTGVTFSSVAMSEIRDSAHNTDRTRAFYVAEAGLNWARSALVSGSIVLPRGSVVGSEFVAYSSDVFGGTNTSLDDIGDMRVSFTRRLSGWQLVSRGAYNMARRTLTLEIEETVSNGVSGVINGHFIRGAVNLSGSSQISGNLTTSRVHFTGTSRLNGNLQIIGDTLVGVVTTPAGAITGSVITVQNVVDFEAPSLIGRNPGGLVWRGNFTAGWSAPPYTLPGSGHYGIIDVASTLNINVPDSNDVVIRVNTLRVGGNIVVTGGGSGRVVFHIDGIFDVHGSGGINRGGDVDRVDIFYYGSDEIRFAGSTLVAASLIAHSADIVVTGSGGIIGNILTGGDSIRVTGGASTRVRFIYAPNASVTLSGSGSIAGVVIANTLVGSGNVRLSEGDLSGNNIGRHAELLNLWDLPITYVFRNWGVR